MKEKQKFEEIKEFGRICFKEHMLRSTPTKAAF